MIALKWALAVSVTAGIGVAVAAVRLWRTRPLHPAPLTQLQQDELALSRQDAEGGPPRHDAPIFAPLPKRNGVHSRGPRAWTNAQLRAWLDVSPR